MAPLQLTTKGGSGRTEYIVTRGKKKPALQEAPLAVRGEGWRPLRCVSSLRLNRIIGLGLFPGINSSTSATWRKRQPTYTSASGTSTISALAEQREERLLGVSPLMEARKCDQRRAAALLPDCSTVFPPGTGWRWPPSCPFCANTLGDFMRSAFARHVACAEHFLEIHGVKTTDAAMRPRGLGRP